MKKILLVAQVLILGLFSSALISTIVPQSVSAGSACSSNFFGLPAWYDGLTDNNCEIKDPGDNINGFVWRIALNIIEAGLMLIGYISVGFVIAGGFRYMLATGQPDKIKAAKDTIRNAIIGLIIALGSVAIVNVIARTL